MKPDRKTSLSSHSDLKDSILLIYFKRIHYIIYFFNSYNNLD